MKTLESFSHFNAEEFIKELKRLRKEKKKLQKKLEEISELPSIDNKSGIKGTEISNPTLNQVIKREKIREKIDEIERMERAYSYAKSKLTKDEKKLLEGFFESRSPNWRFVSKWQGEHYMGSTKTYTERKRVLRKIEALLDDYLLNK